MDAVGKDVAIHHIMPCQESIRRHRRSVRFMDSRVCVATRKVIRARPALARVIHGFLEPVWLERYLLHKRVELYSPQGGNECRYKSLDEHEHFVRRQHQTTEHEIFNRRVVEALVERALPSIDVRVCGRAWIVCLLLVIHCCLQINALVHTELLDVAGLVNIGGENVSRAISAGSCSELSFLLRCAGQCLARMAHDSRFARMVVMFID